MGGQGGHETRQEATAVAQAGAAGGLLEAEAGTAQQWKWGTRGGSGQIPEVTNRPCRWLKRGGAG